MGQASGVTSANTASNPVVITLASSAGRGWQGYGADLLQISAGRSAVPGRGHHRISVHLGAPVRADCRCDGQRRTGLQSHGDASVVPAGVDGVWIDDAACTLLRIWFSDDFAEATADALGRRLTQTSIRPMLQLRDKRLEHLAGAISAELVADDVLDALYAESLCTAAVVRLISGSQDLDIGRPGLTPHVSRRVVDFIESHLDARIVLSDVAAVAGFSVPHLKVLFRETLGVPVHQYIIQRRAERAKSLLLQGKLSLQQIALEAGFSHPSHMAHWLKRLFKLSPSEIVKLRC